MEKINRLYPIRFFKGGIQTLPEAGVKKNGFLHCGRRHKTAPQKNVWLNYLVKIKDKTPINASPIIFMLPSQECFMKQVIWKYYGVLFIKQKVPFTQLLVIVCLSFYGGEMDLMRKKPHLWHVFTLIWLRSPITGKTLSK